MIEIAQNLETTSAELRPLVLVLPAIASVIIGLFVWIGGLGFRKALIATIAAAAAGTVIFFTSARNPTLALAAATVAAVIAGIFQKIFITIFTAALAATIAITILISPHIQAAETFAEQIKAACLKMPLINWAIIALAAIGCLVAGCYLWKFTSALCCATFGTLMIFAGMIGLLLYKGAAPITSINNNQLFYGTAFTATAAFGTGVQLFICPTIRKKTNAKSRPPGN